MRILFIKNKNKKAKVLDVISNKKNERTNESPTDYYRKLQ